MGVCGLYHADQKKQNGSDFQIERADKVRLEKADTAQSP